MADERTSPPALECRRLSVAYGTRRVLHELDLTVAAGEAVAVLGPSGCGKSTLLFAVAGFHALEAGSISIDGRLVADGSRALPPEDRMVGVVFQNYALWPHLTARDNVAYPLRRAGVARTEARLRADALLDRMGVGHLADRRPALLSGGEQQRVGVARALAREPALYLFDEPTAHLDTALRSVLQEELATQRAAIGAAVVYATHDVSEAFVVADRVALLRDGAVVQQGRPVDVYERPVDLWAARLTGPAAVLDLCVVGSSPASVTLSIADTHVRVPADGAELRSARSAQVLVRPEWGRLGGPLPGRVVAVRYRGSDTDYRLDTPVGLVEVRERGVPHADVGDAQGWTIDRAWLLPGSPAGITADDSPREPPTTARASASAASPTT
jgi:ABC-type Fe3+/spermidine/putrescine transport system ATPase subunit